MIKTTANRRGRDRYAWIVGPERARQTQLSLRKEVVTEDRVGRVRLVAGADVGFAQNALTLKAAVVVLRFPELELLERATARCHTRFRYTPGLLAFREAPVVLEALRRLEQPPDLLLYDGHGLAAPAPLWNRMPPRGVDWAADHWRRENAARRCP